MDQTTKELQTTEEHVFKLPNDAALKILNPTGDLVEALAKEYGGLIITDFHDKDQIKVVDSAAQIVRKARIDVNKRRKIVNDATNAFKKEVKKEADILFNSLDLLYKDLAGKRDKANALLADEEKEKELEAAKEFGRKSNILLDAGFLSNGVQYIAGGIIVDQGDVFDMPEEELAKLAEEGKAELARIADLLANAEAEKKKEQTVQVEQKKAPKEEESSLNKFVRETVDDKLGDQQEEAPTEEELVAREQRVADLPFDMGSPTPSKDEAVKSVEVHLEDEIQTVPQDFRLGWDACIAAIEIYFESAPKMTRSDLLAGIKELSPEG